MAIAIGLLKVLLELGRSGKTGAFYAESGGTHVRLFVERGQVVHAEEGGIAETLGRLLVREGMLTQQQYDQALEQMSTLRASGTHVKLGEVLVSLGMLTADEVEDALAEQVRKKAVRALGWPDARVTFIECHGGDLEIARRHPTAIEPLVLASLRSAGRASVEQLFAQAKDRYVALRADRVQGGGAARKQALALLASFEMTEEETAFAESLDGAARATELLEAGDDAQAAVLATLLLTDCLDLHATAQAQGHARPAAQKVEPKHHAPARGPKLRKRTVQTDDKGQVHRVAARMREAREAKKSLPPPPPGEAADADAVETPKAPMARVLAEQSFQNGKRLVRANQMSQAAAELKRAAALFDAPEYQLWAGYAVMRCDPKGEKGHYPALQKLADRAIAEDSECGFAYFVLGHLALRSGEESRALVMFDRARSLDKETVEGARDVRLREAEPEISIAKSSPALSVNEPAPAPDADAAPTSAPTSGRAGSDAGAPPVVASAVAAPPKEPALAQRDATRRTPKWIFAAAAAAVVAVALFLVLRAAPHGRDAASDTSTPTSSSNAAAPKLTPSAAAAVGSVASPTEGTERVNAAADAAAAHAEAADAEAALAVATADAGLGADAQAPLDIDLDLPANDADAGANVGAASADGGTLEFADVPKGYHVFMDGKLLGEPVPTVVGCGAHVVRIGAHGRDQRIEVPCGERVVVPYP